MGENRLFNAQASDEVNFELLALIHCGWSRPLHSFHWSIHI